MLLNACKIMSRHFMQSCTRYRVLQGAGTLYIGIHKGKCINWQSCTLPQVQQNTEMWTSATNSRGWLLALKKSDTFWWVLRPSDLLAFTNRGWLPGIKEIVAMFSFTLHTAPLSAAFAGTSGAVLDVLVLFSFCFYCLFVFEIPLCLRTLLPFCNGK